MTYTDEDYKIYARHIIDESEKQAGLKWDNSLRVLFESIIIVNSKKFYELGIKEEKDKSKDVNHATSEGEKK